MRKPAVFFLMILTAIATAAGATEPATDKSVPAPDTSQGIPLPDLGKISGKVTQTMNASEYTYIEIDTGNGLVWAAGPATVVKVGDSVETSSGFPMVNFRSATLDRTFDEIRFVSVIQVWSPKGGDSESAPADTHTQAPPDPSVSGIERAEGGHTVAEIIEGRTKLSGSKVKVRGVVVKLNTGIMGRNWVHLSDGTVGPNGEQEITVNTQGVPAVGSTVLVHGTVAIDRDFGSGYQYSVLIEDAAVTVE